MDATFGSEHLHSGQAVAPPVEAGRLRVDCDAVAGRDRVENRLGQVSVDDQDTRGDSIGVLIGGHVSEVGQPPHGGAVPPCLRILVAREASGDNFPRGGAAVWPRQALLVMRTPGATVQHGLTSCVLGCGVTGIAWEVGLLAGLAEGGVDLGTADLVVGTSAGSVVGAQLISGTPIEDLYPRPRAPAA